MDIWVGFNGIGYALMAFDRWLLTYTTIKQHYIGLGAIRFLSSLQFFDPCLSGEVANRILLCSNEQLICALTRSNAQCPINYDQRNMGTVRQRHSWCQW